MSRFARATLLTALAACVFAVAGSSAAPARPMTTEPGVIYKVKVTLKGKTVSIAPDRFSRNGKPRYPRGAVIQYVITNKTKESKALQIWNMKSAPIRPGKHKIVLMLWIYRGRFAYYMLSHGKKYGEKGVVTIF
jgi:hypothetical protein